jgi:phosphatidylserine decarboxylase
MSIRPEVIPFVLGSFALGLVILLLCKVRRVRLLWSLLCAVCPVVVLCGFFLYFFRDPERTPPADNRAVVAAADGRIAAVTTLSEAEFIRIARTCGLSDAKASEFLLPDLSRGDPPRWKELEVTRISIYLSLLDVHVNRAPITGTYIFLGYFPGKRFFTFRDKSSELNQHNSIFVRHEETVGLINQIVGPVCRRVVYWPDHDTPVSLEKGDRIGMMKFGSRLDMYFPGGDVEVVVSEGDRVLAGETVVAMLRRDGSP